MTRRETPLRFGTFIDRNIGESIALMFIAALVLSVIAIAIAGGIVLVTNHNVGNNQKLAQIMLSNKEHVKDVSEETRGKRMQMATQVLSLQDLSAKLNKEEPFDSDSKELRQLKQVAKTGEPLKLDLTKSSLKPFITAVYFDPGLLVMWLLFSLVTLIAYMVDLRDEQQQHRLADLPWRYVWPFVVTLMFGPFWWLSMIVSGLLLRWDPPLQARMEPGARDVQHQPRDEWTPPDEWVPPDFYGHNPVDVLVGGGDSTSEVRPAVSRTYASSPNSARAVYVEMRQESAQKNRIEAHKQVVLAVKRGREVLRSLAEQVKSQQGEINDLTSQQQILERAIEETNEQLFEMNIGGEFDRIMSLPGVLAVQVVNNRIRLIVRAINEYSGVAYDLGDWQVDLGADTLTVTAKELRSGVKSSWRGGYPVYRLSTGAFCFGNRERVVNEHLAKAQYVEAMALIVECLCSVNPEHQKDVLQAFHVYKEEMK